MTSSALWDFAREVYRREGVEAACLALQDDLGLDVNAVLFCLWLGAVGRDLTPIADATMAISEDWQPAVAALRTARRQLKSLARDPATVALRERVKDCELDAERLELAALAALAEPTETRAETTRTIAATNLTRYFAAMNISADPLGRAEVLRILDAAFAACLQVK